MELLVEELKRDTSGLCLRCTVDSQDEFIQEIYSSEFQFEGAGWKLNYYKFDINYVLLLLKCSGVAPKALHVSVQFESSESGRVVDVLSQEGRFTDHEIENEDVDWPIIWQKEEEEIVRAVPEFCKQFKLIVVLKLDDDSKTLQTEGSVTEATTQSTST